jgi:hypothetical protein
MVTKKKSKKTTKRKASRKQKQPQGSGNPFMDVGKEMVDLTAGGMMIEGMTSMMPTMLGGLGQIGKLK